MALHTFFFTAPEELARPPVGLEFKEVPHHDQFDATAAAAHAAACLRACDEVMGCCDAKRREQLSLDGHVGVVFERSPYCHGKVQDRVCAVFAGEIAYWPGHDQVAEHHDAFVRGDPLPLEDDADWLVRFYESFSGFASLDDITEAALHALSRVHGSFAFVVYDSVAKRVWAARDAEGVQPLFWGVTDDNRLVFGTDANKVDGCNPTASPFPAGCLFASHDATLCHSPGARGWVIKGDHSLPGTLLSFLPSAKGTHSWRGVKAVPRMDAEGHICGAVYRVSSEAQLGNDEVRSH
ncbi:stem-specific TSJT1-like [Micractinium conductrix]|uniref:Stem-specific TSJT1-like n=1 Tax=Micractinium conductrix TaxID=554055 RepID=A0A2P6VE25_9CHLO|nr:stem-specific TSJT1-like [Micractinium conductrix]|eukprot:PSC72327.1 stem-specific TSJT1-like [Micractinium conductrix]